jgi:acyl CoA:acetate/3-ketoacid CoA transferase
MKTLHIGQGIFFGEEEIIGIFSSVGLNTVLLEKMKEGRKVRNESEKQKSLALVEKKGKVMLYFSRINAGSLIKRITE